jgi:hypothetical protein
LDRGEKLLLLGDDAQIVLADGYREWAIQNILPFASGSLLGAPSVYGKFRIVQVST